MGGISTRPVLCSAYMDAETIDRDIDEYIMAGVLPEADAMFYYSWYFWGMYIWGLDL